MANNSDLEFSGLSARSRPKVAAFIPALEHVNQNFVIGESVNVDMALGENWLIRKPLIEIFKKAMDDWNGENLSYPIGMGGPEELLSAASNFFNQFFNPGISIMPEHVVTFTGASTALDSLLYAICDEGDSIIIPSPFWGGYIPYTKFRVNVNIVTTESLPWTSALNIVETVRTAYENAPEPERIKALLMTNPHNPIGCCYPESILRELMAFCKEKDIHYISDEIFAMTAFSGKEDEKFISALSLVNMSEASAMNPSRVHILYSLSKDFGAAGLRMGFLISPQNRALLSASLLSNYMQISTASSLLTVSLFKSPQLPSLLRTLKSRLITNFSLLTSSFEKWNIKYLPTTAGFHVFAKLVPDAKTWEDEKEVVDRLLQGGVFVVAGRGFGGVNGEIGWIRVAFSVEEEDLREGLRMIGIILGLEKEIV